MMEFYMKCILILVCVLYTGAKQTLKDVINAVKWNELVILYDDKRSYFHPVEEIVSTIPATYHELDLKNKFLIASHFEKIYKLSRMNWLVFCSDCVPLLTVINEFESSHQLQGYFTHLYQWMLVTNFTQTRPELEDHVGPITNVAVVDTAREFDLYTAMFGKSIIENLGTVQETERHQIREGGCDEKKFVDRRRYFNPVEGHIDTNTKIFPNQQNGFNAAKLKFCVLPWEPFIIRNQSVYTGYYIGLLDLIGRELNFTFSVYEPKDGQYGNIKNGEWAGMVRDLMDKKADFAASLTFNPSRRSVADHPNTPVNIFTALYMYKSPEPVFMSLEILAMPFQRSVWISLLVAIIATSLVFLLSHYLNAKWEETQCQSFEYGVYIIMSTLSQSPSVNPSHQSMRIVYSFYSLGCIILITTYTGHLVALLTIKQNAVPFNTIRELAENTEYTLGVTGGTAGEDLLLNSNFIPGNPMSDLQGKLIRDAERDPTVLSPIYEDQVQRVRADKYVIRVTSGMYNAVVQQYCHVTTLKEKGEIILDGFMLQKNSVLTSEVDKVLMKIKEGKLDWKIKQEFWPKPKQCSEDYDLIVRMGNVFGMFCILLGGVLTAFVVLVLEVLCCGVRSRGSFKLAS